ncbi:F-box domain-containing protein [Dioscorea alata]|uniref:F-box domain-containing protein n=1 Tax=Dioscorea alata TaxID=55571 RepID=A0ACB7UPH3_DIOAL|nr:F-box domain-containing protein [Dioscorea alata]
MALGEMTNLQTGNQKLKRNGIKSAHMTRIIGRKRVLVPGHMEDSCFSPPTATPTQKRLQRRSRIKGRLNLLEALPQDILVRTLCKVDHSDLKQLLLVSKSVNEATLVAKDVHFAFSTPSKFGNNGRGGDLWGATGVEEGLETPDAPKQRRAAKSRIDRSKLASISVALFTSPDYF